MPMLSPFGGSDAGACQSLDWVAIPLKHLGTHSPLERA